MTTHAPLASSASASANDSSSMPRKFLASRHGRLVAGGAAAVFLAASVTVATRAPGAEAQVAGQNERSTTTIERTDLVEAETISGTVSSGETDTVVASASGTLLHLAEPGAVIDAGDVIAVIDSEPTPDDITRASQSVTQAEQNLRQAEASHARLVEPADAGDLAAAQAALLASEQRLTDITDIDQATIDAARLRVDRAADALASLTEPAGAAELARAEADLLAARDARTSLDQDPTQAQLDQARLAVEDARELLDGLDEDADEAQLVGAQLALEAALDAQDALRNGPSEATIAAADAAVLAAEEAVRRLIDGPDALTIATAEQDLDHAQDDLQALLDGPDATDIEIARLEVETATDRVTDISQGADADDVAVAALQVDAARHGLEVAESELQSLLEGPRATVVLTGDFPAWRGLEIGDAPGDDVTQLQQNLNHLGYGPLPVDGVYDEPTSRAVAEWQTDLGVDPTGELSLGTIVFLPGPATVTSTFGTERGDTVAAGTPTLELVTTAAPDDDGELVTTQRVFASLDVADRGLVDIGDDATIELPDGTRVPGEVLDIQLVATVAPTGQGGAAETTSQLEIEIQPTGPIDDLWTDAAVQVDLTDEVASDVLTVPVSALIALAEGGYALEVVGSDGTTNLVGVTTGAYAEGRVEIEGAGLDAGTEIVNAD